MEVKQKNCNDYSVFREGLAVAGVLGSQFHILECSGEPAYPERYELAEPFQPEGWAWVKKKSGFWKRIDKKGAEVHGPTSLAAR